MATTVSYLHPHMETRIVDNSTVVDQQANNGTATFMPYFSSRGVDGVIEKYTSYAQFVADKGIPNFKKHGQPIYNVLQFLRGNGVVYGLRLLPENATRANVVLGAKVVNGKIVDHMLGDNKKTVSKPELKENVEALSLTTVTQVSGTHKALITFGVVEEGETESKTKKIIVKESEADDITKGTKYIESNLETSLTGKISSEDINAVKGLLSGDDLTATKQVSHVSKDITETGVSGELLQIVCKGRGVYGNKYEVDLVFNNEMTESYDFSIYELTVKESGRVVEGPYYVSLQPEAVNLAGASMFIKNVIEEYSSAIAVVVNEKLYDAAALLLGDDYAVKDLLKLDNGGITLELANGGDGDSLDTAATVDEQQLTLKDKLLADAFARPEMLSKTRYPIDILLDANYSFAVKEAMHALGKNRGDVFTILDLGPNKVSSANLALQTKNNYTTIANDRCAAFYAQTFTVFDSFTNSDILVTMPYFLAYKIPANDAQDGMQYPVAGPNRGILTGFKSMSFNPTTDEKEELYKARINYAEQDYRNTKLMSQLTSQTATSALSNINNMRVLLRMVRNVEQISENYFFEFANSSTLSHFEQAVNSYLSSWVSNGACQVCQGSVYQNDYDVVQRIVRVSIEVVFTGLIERIVIEFNVGSNAA